MTTDLVASGTAEQAVRARLQDLPPFEPPGWRVLVSIMQKGGVGKTATLTGVLSWLAHLGVPAVGIDLCHTGALTQSFGLERVSSPENLANIMLGNWDGNIEEIAVQPFPDELPKLWIVPISVDMTVIAEDLAGKKFREERLRGALGDLPTKAVVGIDCPPVLDSRTDNALIAGAEEPGVKQFGGTLLCPELVMASMETLGLLQDQIDAINAGTRYNIEHVGWFSSETDDTLVNRRARNFMQELPIRKLGEMPRRTRISAARDAGKPLMLFDRKSDANDVHEELAKMLKEVLHV